MTDGTNQRARFPAGLREDYFRADELRFTDLLSMSEGLAAQLVYADPQNVAAGYWDKLFATDVTFVIASILSLDLQSLQSAFLRDLPGSPVEKLAGDIMTLAHHMDVWLTTLKVVEQHPARVISHRISQLVSQSLGEQLQWVITRFAEQTRAQVLARAAQSLDAIWLVQRSGGWLSSQRSERQLLRTCFFSFVGAIVQLKSLAQSELERSLESRRHAPAVGLLMAFLQLFDVAQKRINRFTRRHAEFYYFNCLRMKQRAAQPDSVHLVCQRDTRATREVVIARGTQFSAGPDPEGHPVVYCADEDLILTDAQVVKLYTLRREHDALISPERELGYVSRLKVDTIVTAQRAGSDIPESHWALFGGTSNQIESDTEHPAQIGLAIASPLLWLKEGAREIRLILRVALPKGSDELRAAIERLCASSESTFFAHFGDLFRLWLLAPEDWLGEGDLQQIRLAARRILGERDTAPGGGDPLSLLIGPNRPERELIFNRIFNEVFDVCVTGPTGWHEVADTFFVRATPGADRAQDGILIVMRLGPEDESVVPYEPAVHGGNFTTRLPMVRICLTARTRLYPYSLLEGLALREIVMAVEVRGARDAVLYNNLGRLDPSKPFIPFGPLPEPGSYLVLGSAEMACKRISALTLHIEWSGLPQSAGGFGEYYRGYVSSLDNDVFRVTTSILRDGEWCPRPPNRREVHLFSTEGDSGRIDPATRLEVDPADLRNQYKATPEALAAEQLQYGPAARNGFVRVQLTEPPGAFGHREYPELLTKVVAANARHPGTHPLPSQPYTPVIERLTFDYQAQSTIHVGGEVSAASFDTAGVESVFHIHPLGAEIVHPGVGDIEHSILPRFEHNGNLYIGVAASKLAGALTLLFHLRDESASRPSDSPPQISWACLASNRWHRIDPRRVLFDTTRGFLTSGIVRLDIPAQIDRLNTILPPELFWLRVSADTGFDSFAGLYAINTQALRATRAQSGGCGAVQVLPAGSITEPVVSIPGLAAVVQIGSSFGGRGEEDPQQLWTRTSERLQHKNRACMPRDYERLVLEHFPDVFKVKCFPSLTTHQHAPSPGNVLIVVIPGARVRGEFDSTLGRRLNAIELDRIAQFVRGIASPFAKVTVRNASYERIQVRCTVKLVRGAGGGLSVRRLNQEIVEFLSPWNDEGYAARFDWVIRREDVEARIRSLDYVEFVTGVSLLRIAQDDSDVCTLRDTARPMDTPSQVPESDHVRPESPWSIAIPTPWHIITSIDTPTYETPEVTGVGELSIGSTFVVGGAGHD